MDQYYSFFHKTYSYSHSRWKVKGFWKSLKIKLYFSEESLLFPNIVMLVCVKIRLWNSSEILICTQSQNRGSRCKLTCNTKWKFWHKISENRSRGRDWAMFERKAMFWTNQFLFKTVQPKTSSTNVVLKIACGKVCTVYCKLKLFWPTYVCVTDNNLSLFWYFLY